MKGEKCSSPRCPMMKKPYPPGTKKKRRRGNVSEYGKELKEKQKLKNWYNLRETQFKKYVRDILEKKGKVKNPAEALIQKLESRLDNAVFRLGFATSHFQARQMVSHGHFLVNGRKVTIPSYEVKAGDRIAVHPGSRKKTAFKNLAPALKKHHSPAWLELDKEKLEGKVTGLPSLEESSPPAEIPAIFEFYSR